MHLYAKFDQNIPACSRAFLLTDHGWTDSHSDYSGDPRVVQDYSTHPRVWEHSHSDYSADPMVVQHSADPRSCNFTQRIKPRVVQYSADQRVVHF